MSAYVQDMYKNVHSSFIHGSPKLETAQMSISRGMDKHTAVFVQWTLTQQAKETNYSYM